MIELKNSKTTYLGGNKFAIDGFIGAVQMREGGEWQDIKPRLIRDADGWHIEGTPYYAELKDNGTRLFCPDRNERSKSLLLPNATLLSPLAKIPVRNPSKIDGQLLPNQIRMPLAAWADILITFTNTGLHFSVLFKKAPPIQFKERFTFDADLAGFDMLKLLAEKQGLGIPRPRLIEADESIPEPEERWLDWSYKDGQLELGFDLTGLRFPVLLQNTTIDKQVGAGSDDGWERAEYNGSMDITAQYTICRARTVASNRYWCAMRWDLGTTIPQSSTIDANTSYIRAYFLVVTQDDAKLEMHFEKSGAAPGTLTTTAYDISGRTRTTASDSWIENSIAGGGVGWYNSPYITTSLQEVVNAYACTHLVAIFVPYQDEDKDLYIDTYERTGNERGAQIHIEYTSAVSFIPRVIMF